MSKSAEAKQLLENPLFIQSFANVREAIVAQIENCPLENDKLSNQLMVSLQLLVSLKCDIENEIQINEEDRFQIV